MKLDATLQDAGAPLPVDLLIEHGVVITMDAGRRILYDGSLAIAGREIVAVGEASELAGRFAAKKVIDARGKAVLPGFVDTHHHFLQNYLKGSRDDLALAEWIDKVSAPRIVMAVADYAAGRRELQDYCTRMGCAEALLSGITCILNMEWATHPDLIGVYEQAGIRAVHTLTMTDYDQWGRPGMLMPMPEAFRLADQLVERCQSSKDGLVSFRYGLACPNSCTCDLMSDARQRARRQGVGVHIHIAETKFEWDNMAQRYGKTPVQLLYDLDFLGPDVLGAHCVWLNDEDIELMRQTGTAVAHNPECNMKVADGIAPIAKMAEAGVIISLGTDSCAVNDNMDMFEAARVAAFLQKVSTNNPAVLPAYQVLEMATLGGARALGVGDRLGSLEAGKLADLILVDLSGWHLRPINSLVNNLVYCASAARDVHTVIVNGRVVVEDRRLLTLNAEQVYAEAEAYAARRFAAAGLAVSPYYAHLLR
jgi:5-methylthioadenosine/S-adenosylhomocysteine deaminase